MNARHTTLALLIAAASLGSATAQAQTVINEAKAVAGGVTPDDTPGYPITISASGSYKLSGNLRPLDKNATAIRVTAPDVSIDLNGYSIAGVYTCRDSFAFGTDAYNQCHHDFEGYGVGIWAEKSAVSLRVKNGTIERMPSH